MQTKPRSARNVRTWVLVAGSVVAMSSFGCASPTYGYLPPPEDDPKRARAYAEQVDRELAERANQLEVESQSGAPLAPAATQPTR